jgi:hypothetical protein
LDLLDRLRHFAAHVRVFDSKQELTIVVTGVQPVEESRANPADVQEARGARGEADSYGHRV